ncbi:uncharacterized protein LOC124622261 [Schistocerca americana]|uniref:uncharacterized protein LOC124622261 n=1 Tax=Schistocerca americana TaxID=7009 RepID=UPI001F4FFB9D|nr:uncharacterized protein LOC124622261 [Schistocerca americana]
MKTEIPLVWALLVILMVCQGTTPNPDPAASAAPGIVLPPRWARDTARNPCALQGWQLVLWPADGHCYRVFQQGPCPVGQELVVSLQGEPLCRCLPGHLRVPELTGHVCYPAHQRGPCPFNHYLQPAVTHSDIGECIAVATCPLGQAVWPPSGQCYKLQQPPARGPCAWGELLQQDAENPALAKCGCKPQTLGYHRQTRSCHQLFTKGPCMEGHILLPDGKCGCHKGLQQYHAPTQTCHTLGYRGPCQHGQILMAGSSGSSAQCQCSTGRVSVHGAAPGCWRPLSRGPCRRGFVVFENEGGKGMCEPEPCPQGLLLHLESKTCHHPGTEHPCPKGKRLLFSDVDPGDVSFLGICDCPMTHGCVTGETQVAHKIENSELETSKSTIGLHNRKGKTVSDFSADQRDKHILQNESKNITNVGIRHLGNLHHRHKQHRYLPLIHSVHYNRNNEHMRHENTLQHQNAEQQKHNSADQVSQVAITDYQYNATQILEDIHKHIEFKTGAIPHISYENESNNTYKQEQILEDIQRHFPTPILNIDQEKSYIKGVEYYDNTRETGSSSESVLETREITNEFLGTVIPKPKTDKLPLHVVKGSTGHRQIDASQKQTTNSCENVGWVLWLGQCYKLYERGPCQHGAWLVPDIRQPEDKLQNQPLVGRCECQPGYHQSDIQGDCRSQLVAISTYLSHIKKMNSGE